MDVLATRRTKIICTIGPATARRIRALAAAGMDVARINVSHGTPASHAAAARAVRRVSGAGDRPLAILTDHQEVDYELVRGSARLIVDTRNAIQGAHPAIFKLGAPRQSAEDRQDEHVEVA